MSRGTSLAYEDLSAGMLPRHPRPWPYENCPSDSVRWEARGGFLDICLWRRASYFLCSQLVTTTSSTPLWSSVLYFL